MAGKVNNREFIKIGNSKTVTVTLRFDVDSGSNDSIILRNAAEAARAMADNRECQTWVRSIEIKE
jgi:hypothetical protein